MYLELAEGENNGNYEALAENPGAGYVFVPSGFLPQFPNDSYVRADYFATNYDPETANAIINSLASSQTVGLSVIPVAAAAGALQLAKNLVAKRQAAVAAGTAKPLFKPGGFFDKIKGKFQGQAPAPAAAAPAPTVTDDAQKLKNLQLDVQVATGQPQQPQQPEPDGQSFFQKNKTAIFVGVGALALVGTILLVTRKKQA